MKYGIPIWYGNKPLKRILKSLLKLKLDYVEIGLDYPWCKRIPQGDREIFHRIKKAGIELAFHAPWAGLYSAHLISDISNAALRVMCRCLKLIAKFEPLYFIFHVKIDSALLREPRFREKLMDNVRKRVKKALKL
jgi:sugar phosphate isomerase/epimerase